MAGIEEILEMISAQQKQTEESIINAAKSKAAHLVNDGEAKAKTAYEEYLKKADVQRERDYENACSSIDAEMKRKLLACKVELINATIEKTLEKLKQLPDNEYFDLIVRSAEKHLRSGEGVIQLSSSDLKRVPSDFLRRLSEKAAECGGKITISDEPADIEDGFILSYGLISENCSFRAIIEAESEEVRDIAARELFG